MSDNEGRRKSVRDFLTHDPLYRRVKDAFLIILALVAAASTMDIPIPFMHNGKTEERLTRLEMTQDGYKERLASIDGKLDRIEDILMDRPIRRRRGQ